MKKIQQLLLLLILISLPIHAQYTAVPDDQFEIILIIKGIDSEGIFDGQVLTSDMEAVINLSIWNVVYLNDLTGIEACINLENLSLIDVGISTLDLSYNVNLVYLKIFDTALESLNIRQNINLVDLYIGHCNDTNNNCFFSTTPPISILDTQKNVALKYIHIESLNITNVDFSNNPLLELVVISDISTDILDFSNNPSLYHLHIWNNDNLNIIDLKNCYNTDLYWVEIHDNPNITCVQVDDPAAVIVGNPPYDHWVIEGAPTITDDCAISVDEQLLEAFKLYPNPTTDILYIKSDGNYTIKSIKIYDMFGKLLQLEKTSFTALDLKNKPQGMFLIKIETDKGVYSKLILKIL